jgi:hypothetical protein
LIDAVHPTAVEVVWAKQGIAGYGLGPKKMSEQYAYIAPQTKHGRPTRPGRRVAGGTGRAAHGSQAGVSKPLPGDE